MVVKQNKDGSYSASLRYGRRMYVADAETRAEAIQWCWDMAGARYA